MNPFDGDGLWLKSRLFINRALDPSKDFEERAFWACTALELLGKSALAAVSPLLVANPMDDGHSLLVASGVRAASDAQSVQAKAVWSRCERAFKPFNSGEAKKLSTGRNAYIHSAAIGFDAIPEKAWWPSYWAQAIILLQHLGKTPEQYVGVNAAVMVEAALTAKRDNLKRQLEARLERARTRLAQREAGTLSARETADWGAFNAPYASHTVSIDCPSCGSSAILGGDEKLDTRVEMEQLTEDPLWKEPVVTVTIATDSLHCPKCHLMIDEYELLIEAGIDTSFDAEGDVDDLGWDLEYNNE